VSDAFIHATCGLVDDYLELVGDCTVSTDVSFERVSSALDVVSDAIQQRSTCAAARVTARPGTAAGLRMLGLAVDLRTAPSVRSALSRLDSCVPNHGRPDTSGGLRLRARVLSLARQALPRATCSAELPREKPSFLIGFLTGAGA